MSRVPLDVSALVWGVKESFRTYVEGAGGGIETCGGAARDADGAFVFPPTSPGRGLSFGADGTLQGALAFTGEVRFQAHGGMLNVRLIDPALEITADGGVLTADEGAGKRYPMVQLDLKALTHDDGKISIPTRLTPDGAYWLGGNYAASTPVDPLHLNLAR